MSEDENTTSKDMTLADKLINVSIKCLLSFNYRFVVYVKYYQNNMNYYYFIEMISVHIYTSDCVNNMCIEYGQSIINRF